MSGANKEQHELSPSSVFSIVKAFASEEISGNEILPVSVM
jgi:hypothetical protein